MRIQLSQHAHTIQFVLHLFFLQGTSSFFNTLSIFNRDPPPVVLLNFWKVHKKTFVEEVNLNETAD